MIVYRFLLLHDGGQNAGLAGIELLAGHIPGVTGVNLFAEGCSLHKYTGSVYKFANS
jgi:hypothetical protein